MEPKASMLANHSVKGHEVGGALFSIAQAPRVSVAYSRENVIKLDNNAGIADGEI